MMLLRTLLAASLACLALPALAQDAAPVEEAPAPVSAPPPTASATLTLSIDSTGDIERKLVTYRCDTEETLSVQYVNAPPNFLAILPVDGENHVFVTTLSGSGARYVSGPYEWWNKGNEGTLRDLMQDEDAAPIAQCTEVGNTP